MALVTCALCTARYPDDVEACPNCGSTTRLATGSAVASVTVACLTEYCPALGVERRVMLRPAAPGVLERPALVCASCRLELPALTEDHDMPKITAHGGPSNAHAEPTEPTEPTEGGEESSPGSSSSTSFEKDSSSPKTSGPEAPSPAPRTGSRSKKARTDSSTAASTDGDPTEDTSESEDEAPK